MIETRQTGALWTQINPVPAAYPWLTEDIESDVAIVGGGVTGALCALRLQEEGLDTILLSAGPVGFSGTAASSGTAHYEIPGGMARLAEKIGIERAVRAFFLCREGIEMIDNLVHNLDSECGCRRSDSLIFTTQEGETEKLRQEYLLRKHNCFPVEYLPGDKAGELFSFEMDAAIVSRRMSVSVDPYRFTHAVLARAAAAGVRVYENTAVEEISCGEDLQMLRTGAGKQVSCRNTVLAMGAGARRLLPAAGTVKHFFSAATEPADVFSGWPGKCVIQNFAGTLSFSVTPDNRIVAQGLGSGLTGVRGKRAGVIPGEAFYGKKYTQLSQEISAMFPGIRARPAHFFEGEYPLTANGLPVISRHRDHPGCIFTVCGGACGLAWSPIAAKLTAEMILEKPNPDHAIFLAR